MKDIFKLKDSANIGINKLMMDGNRVFFQGSKNTLKKRGERGKGVGGNENIRERTSNDILEYVLCVNIF